MEKNTERYRLMPLAILWEINKWRTSDNWHCSNDREEEHVKKTSRYFTVSGERAFLSNEGLMNVSVVIVVSDGLKKGELDRDALVRTYGCQKNDPLCERWSSRCARARIIRRRRHTLDNKRYTRTAFALCLNDVISCLYLPFTTTVSFPPVARSARKIPSLPVIVLHPCIICNWFEPTGYKLSMLHRYISIRFILTSSVSNALPSHFEKRW